jgi:adenylate cyclase, class 2
VASGVESEIKLAVGSAAEARDLLSGLGASLARPRHLEDNLLLDDAARTLSARGLVLRLRRAEAAALLTYKAPRREVEGVKSRTEIEFAVSDADGCLALLEGLGFRPTFRYQKYRETYRWGGTEIVIDETPVGTFLEIEGEIEAIHQAARALGRGPEDYLRDSYVSLFFARGGRGDMVF